MNSGIIRELRVVAFVGLTALGLVGVGAQTVYVPGGAVGSSSNTGMGVGVASPTERLHVNGNLLLSNGENASIFPSGHFLYFGGRPDYAHVNYVFRPSWGTPSETFSSIAIQIGDQTGTFSTRALINSAGTSYLNGGFVGIGTASPWAKLDVAGGDLCLRDVAGQEGYRVKSYANANSIWLMPTNRGAPSLVLGRAHDWDQSLSITYDPATVGAAGGVLTVGQASKNVGTWTHGITRFHTNGSERLRINASGNVGIGTTTPSHKLSVNGTIKAKEVIVETTGWSDYVFADDYRLAPLSEVEAHIKAEKRLPGIPSEQQVAEQGVSVGEMQAALLAKIEELTLYSIKADAANRELREANRAMEERLAKVEAFLADRVEE